MSATRRRPGKRRRRDRLANSSTSGIRSTEARAQVGQETTSMPPRPSPTLARIWRATRISRTGSAVSETRMVLPMPSMSRLPMPSAERMLPAK
jgi:hypothetical protein